MTAALQPVMQGLQGEICSGINLISVTGGAGCAWCVEKEGLNLTGQGTLTFLNELP